MTTSPPSSTRIYLSPPHMGESEQQFVAEAFASNWIAPLGPHVDGFEREVAKYVGSGGALTLTSGTAAIHLVLRYFGVDRGDTVFCSSLTFIVAPIRFYIRMQNRLLSTRNRSGAGVVEYVASSVENFVRMANSCKKS